MFSFNHRYSMDTGIAFVYIYMGIGMAIISFIMIVIIEAWIMRKYLSISRWKRIGYSFVINTISTIIGLPIGYWAGSSLLGSGLITKYISLDLVLFFVYEATVPFFALWEYFWGLLFGFVLSIVIEYFCTKYLIKPKLSDKNALNLVFRANIISYLVLISAPPAIKFVIDLLIS